jgi:hypothetical protein
MENCNHKKVYAEYILTSSPPQYPWVCSECGEHGVDREFTLSANKLWYDESKAITAPIAPIENTVEFTLNGEPVLLLKPNGDIFVKGRLVENDQEVVDGMRTLLGHPVPKPTTGLSFSKALELIKQGKKVKRAGWGGYWFYTVSFVKRHNEVMDTNEPDTYERIHIIMARLKDGGYAPAAPYQEDLLSSDWEVVG